MKKILAIVLANAAFLAVTSGSPYAGHTDAEEKTVRHSHDHTHSDKHISHKEGQTPLSFGGIAFGFGATMVIQGTSGNSDNAGKTDTTGGGYSTDFEITVPFGENGTAFSLIDSGTGGEGVDTQLGTFQAVNGDANPADDAIAITEIWYEQTALNSLFTFTFGQLDLSNYFDGNEVANDETSQFLGAPFVNGTVINFPDPFGLGFRLTFSPLDLVDFTIAWQENGDDEAPWDDLFGEAVWMGEVAVRPSFAGLQGNYRLFGWTDSSAHTKWKDVGTGTCGDVTISATEWKCQNNAGIGVSVDQQITGPLAAFFRFSTRDEELSKFDTNLSGGLALSGEMWGRGSDTVGAGYSVSSLSDKYKNSSSSTADEKSSESHLEIYYNAQLNDNFSISPDLQFVTGGDGADSFEDVWVFGVRTQLFF
ncbi:MAG: carbohydrate porin [Nitrospinota bacterium]